jgi:hypothetical protein
VNNKVVTLMPISFSGESEQDGKGGGKLEEPIGEGLSNRPSQPTNSGGLELRSLSKPVKLGVSTQSGTIRVSMK